MNENNLEQVYTLSLTGEQMDLVKDLFCEALDYGDHKEEKLLGILEHLTKVRSMELARSIIYVAMYEVSQQYGGPEEGGWYYHTYELVSISPVVVFDEDFSGVAKEFILYCDDLSLNWKDHIVEATEGAEVAVLTNTIKSRVLSGHSFQVSELDRYGQGFILRVETQFGQSHNLNRRRYE